MEAKSNNSRPRGACPTLDDPMVVADGLLARFRPTTGLDPAQINALADASEAFGNGLIEVTARGNLQIRGLTSDSAPQFRAAIDAAGIEPEPAPAIEISPIAGIDPLASADPRPLAAKLRDIANAALANGDLSPKLSIVLATGGQILLGPLKADIRLVAHDRNWALEVGGTTLGSLEEQEVCDAVATLLAALQRLGSNSRGSDLEPAVIMRAVPALQLIDHAAVRPVGAIVGPLSLSEGQGMRVGLPFGQIRAWQMREMSRIMAANAVAEMRTAPDRTVVLIGSDDASLRDLAPALSAIGFVTRPEIDRHPLTICSGAERSDAGIIQAAELAQALSTDTELVDGSFHLHVSTCAKGCSHTGRPGVVLEGDTLRLYRAPDAKALATFDPAAIEAAIVSLGARIRDTRRPGEATLSVFDRLGHL